MKYTTEITIKILDHIKAGVPNRYAAQACGVGESTFYEWVEKHAEFAESLRGAEGERVATLVKGISRDRSVIGKMWLLERIDRVLFHLPTGTEREILDRLQALEERTKNESTDN